MTAAIDWAVVGGGVHGAFLARSLQRAGIRDLAVLDPHDDPLEPWRTRATACGMDYLRSPRAHHLGAPADNLRDFAHARGYDARHFLGRYRRPSRAVFEAHADACLAAPGIPRLRDHVRRLERVSDGWRLHGDTGVLRARRVLLAPGPPPLRRPAWAGRTESPHVFDERVPPLPVYGDVAVIGGGITAAQAALAFAGAGRTATLVCRHPLRRAEFDSEPCYAGPLCMRPFAATGDLRRRRWLIREARRPGSLPPDLNARLAAAVAQGQVRLVQGEADGLTDSGLRLTDGRRLRTDTVRLATGFADTAPGLDWLGPTIERERLPLAPCGFPAPDGNLQWGPGLFVSGRLAELELGPMAGNIRGARAAGVILEGVVSE